MKRRLKSATDDLNLPSSSTRKFFFANLAQSPSLPKFYSKVFLESLDATLRLRPGTERLLVMDDEEALRNLLATVLTTLGYEVQTAGDGAEAIVLFEKAKACGRGDALPRTKGANSRGDAT